jgi:hypothetical protein
MSSASEPKLVSAAVGFVIAAMSGKRTLRLTTTSLLDAAGHEAHGKHRGQVQTDALVAQIAVTPLFYMSIWFGFGRTRCGLCSDSKVHEQTLRSSVSEAY